MEKFIVTETVHYVYEVEAENAQDAVRRVREDDDKAATDVEYPGEYRAFAASQV